MTTRPANPGHGVPFLQPPNVEPLVCLLVWLGGSQTYHLVLTNIAMENPFKWKFSWENHL